MTKPTSIEELREVVVSSKHVRLRGGATKPGLARPRDDGGCVDLTALSGIVEHVPEECTFTALAGTRIADIERLLGQHGQYLPFDPPLVEAGATIGGAVAAGVNGSCRYRYGGIRDFVIGARIVDGRGRLVASGGKVVKNAAGFLLHQAMVGSAGRLGILAELTFKVFPRAPASATIRCETTDLEQALETVAAVQSGRFELEALDVEAPSVVWLRLGGFAGGVADRVAAVRRCCRGVRTDVLLDDEDRAVWHQTRELRWAPAGAAIVRVPATPPSIPRLDGVLAAAGASRRYAVGGHVAFIAWPGTLATCSEQLDTLGLSGQVLIGPPGRPIIGAVATSDFERRVRDVMDPDRRFADD
jgi:glycolate oxidase FAD binding subunit